MSKNKGFTLVELVIAMPVILIVMGGIMGLLITLLNDFSAQRTRQSLNVAAQTAFTQIESDVKLSSAFLTKSDTTTYNDPYAPSGAGTAWSHKGLPPTPSANARVLILQTYATSANPLSDIRSPVYISSTGTQTVCSGDALYANEVLSNTVIYFLKNNTLFRRTLVADPAIVRCGGATAAFQLQSCAANTPSRNAACKIDDTEVLQNVSQFSVEYYTSSVSPSAIPNVYTSTNPAILDNAIMAEITVKHSATNSNIINTAVLRVTRIN